MLHLLVDTSTWLDLSKRRDGQRWIVAIRVLVHQGALELLVPSVVIDEYGRNRARVEASMTASIEQRFKLIKQDLDEYGGTDYEQALLLIDELAHEVPLIGAMTTRNSTRSWAYCAPVARLRQQTMTAAGSWSADSANVPCIAHGTAWPTHCSSSCLHLKLAGPTSH